MYVCISHWWKSTNSICLTHFIIEFALENYDIHMYIYNFTSCVCRVNIITDTELFMTRNLHLYAWLDTYFLTYRYIYICIYLYVHTYTTFVAYAKYFKLMWALVALVFYKMTNSDNDTKFAPALPTSTYTPPDN